MRILIVTTVFTAVFIANAQFPGNLQPQNLGNLINQNLGSQINQNLRNQINQNVGNQIPNLNVRGQINPNLNIQGQINPNLNVRGQIDPNLNIQGQINQNSIPPIFDPNNLPIEVVLQREWDNFKRVYNKVYQSPQEENFRREAFIENRNKVLKFNTEYSFGLSSFVQQLNSYADQLHNEFHTSLNGFNRTGKPKPRIPTATAYIPSANVGFPVHVDWRELGAVSSVKQQGVCASCYAHAAAGALEGHNYRKTGELVELSVQNILDCSEAYGNEGCTGGYTDNSYEYVRQQPGLDTEASYPYEGAKGQCRWRADTVGAYCTGYVEIPQGDERAIESAVATLGPVSAAIDASQDSFQFYSDGIYFDAKCSDKYEDMNHAILIVGYGQETNGQKYWLIKNSYGDKWGSGGYFKLAKDVPNHCGIANIASYPLV